MTTSDIEWLRCPCCGRQGDSWNPTTGCDQVSPGCDNCYAMGLAKRWKAAGSAKYQVDGAPRTSGPGFGLTMHPQVLPVPLSWRAHRRVFVNSMSDLFHPRVGVEFIARVFAVMARTPQHTYLVLTKRAPRMASLLDDGGQRLLTATRDEETAQALYDAPWPLPNLWTGVSVEDQQRADERIPHLVRTPAAVRWVSAEPLLGQVDLSAWLVDHGEPDRPGGIPLDWVVVGGETAPRARVARPMHPDWARALRDQCAAAGVGFFFKQWGAWAPPDQFDTAGYDDVDWDQNAAVTMWPDGRLRGGVHGEFGERYETLWPAGKRHTGHRLDGVEHLESPRQVVAR